MEGPYVRVRCRCGAILRCRRRYDLRFRCHHCGHIFRFVHAPRRTARSQTPDPYSILGIRPGSTKGEIRKAYLSLMTIYHPDKVAHLAPEYHEISQAKSRAINEAYRQLKAEGWGEGSGM